MKANTRLFNSITRGNPANRQIARLKMGAILVMLWFCIEVGCVFVYCYDNAHSDTDSNSKFVEYVKKHIENKKLHVVYGQLAFNVLIVLLIRNSLDERKIIRTNINNTIRKAFMDKIVNRYTYGHQTNNFEIAKLLSELVLRYMTTHEIDTIRDAYKNTNINDSVDLSRFVRIVTEIVDNVISREPRLEKLLRKAVNENYTHSGWNYSKSR